MSLKGAAVVAHGGGPTHVINSSLAGVVEECRQRPEITGLFGARHGILGVLNDGSSAAQAEWLANQLRDKTNIVLMQHGAIEPDAAWRIYPGLSINRALELLDGRVVGVIGGHWLSGDYVQFKPLERGVFGLFSNWQSRTNASGSGWYGWVTVLTLTRTQWCVKTLNVLTGARDRFEDPSCLKR